MLKKYVHYFRHWYQVDEEGHILPLKFKIISDKVGQINATRQVKLIKWKYTICISIYNLIIFF